MDSRKQGSTTHPMLFLMVSASDHVTGLTGLIPVVTLSKDGATFAAAAGTVSEVGAGWYALAGNAADRDTPGELVLHATATGADPSDKTYTVVPFDPFDAQRLGLAALPSAGTLQVKPAVTLAAADVTGKVAATVATGDGADAASVKATLGTAGAGLTALGDARLAHLDADVSGRSTFDPASDTVAHVTLVDTCAANTDMRGTDNALLASNYTPPPSLAQVVAGVWDEPQAGHTTAATFGKYLDAAVSGVSTGGVSASDIATAVWQDLLSGADFATAGSIGALVKTNLDAKVSTAGGSGSDPWSVVLPGSYAAGTAGSILGNTLDANVVSVAGTTVNGPVNPPTLAQIVAGLWDELVSNHVVTGSFARLLSDYLDAKVSERLAAAAYTAPDNTTLPGLLTADKTAFTATALANAPAGGGGSGDATAANQTTIIGHLTDIKGTNWTAGSDDLHAIRAQGDSAWKTATGFATAGDAMALTAAYDAAKTPAPTTTAIAQAVLMAIPVPRDVTAVTTPTVADCLVAAFVEAAGNESVVDTAYTKMQPDNTSTFVATTLDNADTPTGRTR